MQPDSIEQAGSPPAAPSPDKQMAPAKPGEGAAGSGEDGPAIKAFRVVGLAAMKKIYDNEEVRKGIIQSLQEGADNPVESVARVAAIVLGQVNEAFAGKLPGVPADFAYAAAPGVVAELGMLGTAAKAFKFTPDMIDPAVQMVGKLAGQQSGGQPVQGPAPAQPGAVQPAEPQAPAGLLDTEA